MADVASLSYLPSTIGIDEAGRGPLAGPVYAAAVLIPDGVVISGLNDSKKLSLTQRNAQENRIKEACHWAIASVPAQRIDQVNILRATWEAMMEAYRSLCSNLGSETYAVAVDGNQLPMELRGFAEAIVKGDSKVASIAAASILAKTARDRYMAEVHQEFPEYGFNHHFGYGSADHIAAIARLGPCPEHRLTFRPLRKEESLFGDEFEPAKTR